MISERATAKGKDSAADEVAVQEAIRRADGRCQMCGRIAAKHGLALAKGKRLWADCGGGDPSSVWTICLECRDGVRAYLRSLGIRPETLRRVSSFKNAHTRIGELLKAFGVGRPTPSSLISSIADVRSWKARLRELRQLPYSWKIRPRRYKDSLGRTKCDYVLLEERRWPEKPGRAARGERTSAARDDTCHRTSGPTNRP
jgi:hypothetical protein